MISNPLLGIGILLIAGYFGGRAANAVKLPRVSGYLIAGMLLSQSCFNILSSHLVAKDLYIITEIALGIIAFNIGGSLIFRRIQRLGKNIVWITFFQAGGVLILSTLLLVLTIPLLTCLKGPDYDLLRTYFPMSLIIGAISVSTAPGAILAIISELKSKGPFTSTLLGIIALGDGLAIILFALACAAAHALINPETISWFKIMGGVFSELSLSLVLGILSGTVLVYTARIVHRREALMMVVIGFIFITIGIAVILKFSSLLACMAVGFIIVNTVKRHHDFFLVVEQIEEPLYGLFFGLAGAHVDFGAVRASGLLALAIIFARMGGKELGTWAGAKISHAPENVKKYLGIALLPKAGVTVGLVLVAEEIFTIPLVADILVNAVIGSVIINELISPPMVKYALHKAGEIPATQEAL